MSDGDLINLYSGRILELAADIPRTGRLAEPTISNRKRAPLCGSTVTVDLKVEDDRVTDYGQDVKACALGQAAASIIGSNIVGLTRTEIETARSELRKMLTEGAEPPSAPFHELKVLAPARDFRNRHASIMLTFDAVSEAFDELDRLQSGTA